MPALRALLFDLDGTLIDTAPDFAFVLNQLLTRHGRQPVPWQRVRQTVSDGAGGLITLGFGARTGDPDFEPLRQELLALYADHLADESQLFPGMEEVLALTERHRVAWGLVTNKPAVYAEPLIKALELGQRCRTLVCPDHVARRKPDPEALLLACDQLGCTPAEAIYVGDHRRDIEAAQAASMYAVACTFGYVHEDDPCHGWGADAVIDSPEELHELIESIILRQSITA